MPPLECKGTKTQCNLCQKPPIKRKNFIFHRKSWSIQKNDVPLHRNTGFSAVGSALRSGRRGRAFESPNPDCKQERLPKGSLSCLCLFAPGGCPEPVFSFFERQVGWAKGDKGSVSFVGGTPPLFYFPDIFLFTCAWSGCLLAFHLFTFSMISLGSVGIAPLCVHT